MATDEYVIRVIICNQYVIIPWDAMHGIQRRWLFGRGGDGAEGDEFGRGWHSPPQKERVAPGGAATMSLRVYSGDHGIGAHTQRIFPAASLSM